MMKYIYKSVGLLTLSIVLGTGCVGLLKFPEPFQHKPWTIITQGEQYGRDQLANRSLAASHIIPLKGWYENTVISVLGQPQEIKVTERKVSEDWYFIYYKHYKMAPRTPEGLFIVRFYHGKVIDVINMN